VKLNDYESIMPLFLITVCRDGKILSIIMVFVVTFDALYRCFAVRFVVTQQLTTSELRERISSDVSQRQFVHSSTDGDTTITVSDTSRCDDVTGCACGNDQASRHVTSYIQYPASPCT